MISAKLKFSNSSNKDSTLHCKLQLSLPSFICIRLNCCSLASIWRANCGGWASPSTLSSKSIVSVICCKIRNDFDWFGVVFPQLCSPLIGSLVILGEGGGGSQWAWEILKKGSNLGLCPHSNNHVINCDDNNGRRRRCHANLIWIQNLSLLSLNNDTLAVDVMFLIMRWKFCRAEHWIDFMLQRLRERLWYTI